MYKQLALQWNIKKEKTYVRTLGWCFTMIFLKFDLPRRCKVGPEMYYHPRQQCFISSKIHV